MLYSIILYGEDGAFERLPEEIRSGVMDGHHRLQAVLAERGKFATIKLMPVSSAVTLTPPTEAGQAPLVVDGPFAETKERFLGFYAAEFASLEEAIEHAEYLSTPYVRIEVRPVQWAGGVLADESEDGDMA